MSGNGKGKNQNVLVVCTAGQHRSPTTARLLKERFDLPAKSCGIHPQATQQVNQKLINWSDYIIVMDERTDGHKSYLKERFDTSDRPVYVFDIPDVYGKNDPELISLLEDKLEAFVDRIKANQN